jgi:hypothetical protein
MKLTGKEPLLPATTCDAILHGCATEIIDVQQSNATAN